jgi:hypothetical protein
MPAGVIKGEVYDILLPLRLREPCPANLNEIVA